MNWRQRAGVGGLVALSLVLTACGLAPDGQDLGTSEGASAPAVASSSPVETEPTRDANVEPAAGSALAALEELDVKGRAPKTGYDREQFGAAWSDTDHNGCDTRNDILARDLVAKDVDSDGCTVRSAWLADPYSRDWVPFVRGEYTSDAVQVDHVVALSDAWQKGAQQMTAAQREQFANDPLNLLAVEGSLNQQKGDGDAATWLPPNKSIRCDYVARQVAVKHKYGLWVTAAEKEAIARVLSSCPEQPLPTAGSSLEVTPTEPRPADEPGSVVGPSEPSRGSAFANCTEAREAGAAPLRRGEPGYGAWMDGDGDGIACE